MEKTHYFCDKCKKEVPERKDLKGLTIKFDKFYESSSGMGCYTLHRHEQTLSLCHECTTPLGLTTNDKDGKPETNQDPTIKDKLYDIFVQIIQEEQQAQN